jgi:hypothetical protein
MPKVRSRGWLWRAYPVTNYCTVLEGRGTITESEDIELIDVPIVRTPLLTMRISLSLIPSYLS